MARRKGKKLMRGTAQRLNSIGATDIRRQRGEVRTEVVQYEHELDDGKVERRALYTVDRVQDFLSRYERRHEITEKQAKAGQRFARDCEGAGIWPKSSFAGGGGGDLETAVRCIGDHSRMPTLRVRDAKQAMGPLAQVVEAVAFHGQSAHAWATAQGKAPRDGMALLREGLEALVRHYGVDR